ncbi:MAG: hypothetical protein CVT64_02735 [Actinobacteria bacterium HGW-Actinobacteria-4]|nr:MAG: hypothetical protein CVT64_02735 [Actinobacteria bacterium HGW-Actinobacteria-4]
MAVVVHGVPGASLGESSHGSRDDARQGAFFERVVGGVLESWLKQRSGVTHLFHDVADLRDIPGIAGLGPISLGATNIDHVVLSGTKWLMVDAKNCAKGTLCVENKKGIVRRASGEIVPQPWLDSTKAKSQYGALFRVTGGMDGTTVFVVPDTVALDETLRRARVWELMPAFARVSDVVQGGLDEIFSPSQPEADPRDVEQLVQRLSRPDVERIVS